MIERGLDVSTCPSVLHTANIDSSVSGPVEIVVDLPLVEETAEPETGTGFPSRPEPGDQAFEVWQLVERAQNGETEAFGLIYDRYMDTVFRFIYFRVGNRQLAEDLTSDTFLRALKRIGSFTWQGRDLGAWLVTIARNLVADHFKSGRYRLEVTTGDVLDADREDRGPEGSPESAVVDHITNVTLLTAVKQLNPEQQECIVLRFLQGFSVAETAQAMSKNEGAIKALQYRAVRALARLLPDGFQAGANLSIDTPIGPSESERANRIGLLSSQQRAVYLMVVEQGMTCVAAAAHLQIAASTVRGHLKRAKQAIIADKPITGRRRNRRYGRRVATDLTRVDLAPPSLMRLPIRTREVIRRLAAGSTKAEIATALGIAQATVRVHLSNAMRLLMTAEPTAST